MYADNALLLWEDVHSVGNATNDVLKNLSDVAQLSQVPIFLSQCHQFWKHRAPKKRKCSLLPQAIVPFLLLYLQTIWCLAIVMKVIRWRIKVENHVVMTLLPVSMRLMRLPNRSVSAIVACCIVVSLSITHLRIVIPFAQMLHLLKMRQGIVQKTAERKGELYRKRKEFQVKIYKELLNYAKILLCNICILFLVFVWETKRRIDNAIVLFIAMTDDQEFSLTRFCDITTRVASLSSPYNLDVVLEMFDEITKLFSVITRCESFLRLSWRCNVVRYIGRNSEARARTQPNKRDARRRHSAGWSRGCDSSSALKFAVNNRMSC